MAFFASFFAGLLFLSFLVSYSFEDQALPLKILSDKNFEHDTQASTGQTTGRWLVLFTSPDCETCQEVEQNLLKVANQHSGKFIFAKIDVSSNQNTYIRFNITQLPSLLLFRDRKFYVLPSYTHSIPQINEFLESGYTKADSKIVPKEISAFKIMLFNLLQYYDYVSNRLIVNPLALCALGALVAMLCYRLTLWVLNSSVSKRRIRKGVRRQHRSRRLT